jgi:hypothetical protein
MANSTYFHAILSKCSPPEHALGTDEKHLLHRALLALLRDYGQTSLSDESLLHVFSELVDEKPDTPLLSHFCETIVPEIGDYPRVIGGGLFVEGPNLM